MGRMNMSPFNHWLTLRAVLTQSATLVLGQKKRKEKRTFPSRRDPPPSPSLGCTWVPTELDKLVASPLIGMTGHGHPIADRIQLERGNDWGQHGQDQQDEDKTQMIIHARPTLSHFSPARCSSFYTLPWLTPCPPTAPPFCPVHSRMGLPEATFEALLTSEIMMFC